MKKQIISLTLATILFAGCGAKTADTMGGNVYTPNQLNQVQKLQNITIIDVESAKVTVNNDGDQTVSTGVGAVLGGLAGAVAGYAIGGGSSSKGAMIGGVAGATLGGVAGNKVAGEAEVVDAVTIIYKNELGEVYTSTQAGSACEFTTGHAYLISANGRDTRIQSNARCK